MYHLFCAHLINMFLFLRGVELRHFFRPKWLGCLGFIICYSNSYERLHIEVIHILLCVQYFMIFLGVLNLDIIKSAPPLGYLLCVACV